MEISYNLRYQKFNFAGRLLIDKEGEIIVYEKGFRLKGKGAGDKGELINFSEIKEFYYKDERLIFITFNKEKYSLADMGGLFDQFILDMYKSRNEFLMDALFMRGGKLRAEFEGNFERQSKFGKLINKGHAKLRLYDCNLVVIPETQDAFSINFNFVNFYEFDELDYFLKVVMDDGTTIVISQLGNDYELFQEKMDLLLGGMYETVVNDVLKELFPHYHSNTLLKLAFAMKGGKAVSLKEIEKMDKELAKSVEEFIFSDKVLAEKFAMLREQVDSSKIFYGIAKDETVKGSFVRYILVAIPEKNAVAFCLLPRWQQNIKEIENFVDFHSTFFYKIIVEKGVPADKIEDKVKEIEQSLIVLRFAKDPCYKDKRELKHSPYQYAIRKLPFLRILRKSYVGRVGAKEVEVWQAQANKMLEDASEKIIII